MINVLPATFFAKIIICQDAIIGIVAITTVATNIITDRGESISRF